VFCDPVHREQQTVGGRRLDSPDVWASIGPIRSCWTGLAAGLMPHHAQPAVSPAREIGNQFEPILRLALLAPDNGREFCGTERHPYELYLALNDIELAGVARSLDPLEASCATERLRRIAGLRGCGASVLSGRFGGEQISSTAARSRAMSSPVCRPKAGDF
jgi:hypothetical protein